MQTTLRSLTAAWPLVLSLLLPSFTHAETAVQAWVQRYNGLGDYFGPGNSSDQANAVAVDGSNNVIVTGLSVGSESWYDYATIKYSSAGVPLWTNRYNGPGNDYDEAYAVAVDGSNNVIVTGESIGSGSAQDYATIKYSSTGVPLWTNFYNGSGNSIDKAYAMAVDGSNDVIVTGESFGSGGRLDYATIKYSSAGMPLWTNRYHGTGNGHDIAVAIAVDGSNNVIVTGHSIREVGSSGNDDYATIKYSSEGEPLWTNRYNGPGNSTDYAYALAVDGSNNVIVTGGSTGNGSGPDYATIKYSSGGEPLWTNRYNGQANGQDYAKVVRVDRSNDVVVTGYSGGGGSGYDYATIKYSGAGVPLWTNRYNGSGNDRDEPYAMAVDDSNNVIVAGSSYSDRGSRDYVTIKYSSTGVPLWTNRCGGSDGLCAMAVDHDNNVVLAGTSAGVGSGYDYATIKYTFPLVITDFRLAGRISQILLDNLQPGALVIEASTNLPDLAGWAPVFTNTTPTNVLFYADPDAGTGSSRFYRAFQSP